MPDNDLIQLKAIERLEEESGDRDTLLTLVLNGRGNKQGSQGKDSPYPPFYLLPVDGIVELVNDLAELLPGQFGPEAIKFTLGLMILLEPLCAFGSRDSG